MCSCGRGHDLVEGGITFCQEACRRHVILEGDVSLLQGHAFDEGSMSLTE